ncbi:MAG: SMC-Scp complex subunit ScpB [Deltaproteobacteria bacterium]|nr:SMC-Scp complex subunit ScpB [Deltaproteobacteria bacterium]
MELNNIETLFNTFGFENIDGELAQGIQSILFVSDKPVSVKTLKEYFPEKNSEEIKITLTALEKVHSFMGIRLLNAGGGYFYTTSPDVTHIVEKFISVKPQKLSRASLETLAVVAYLQPVTQLQVNEIRGVQSDSSLKYLIEKGFVKVIGRLEEPGRPILYATTKEFLQFFSLNSLSDLPSFETPVEDDPSSGEYEQQKLQQLLQSIVPDVTSDKDEIMESLKEASDNFDEVRSREQKLMITLGLAKEDTENVEK